MIGNLKSEFYRMKGTWLFPVHVILPIIYALVFFLMCKFTGLKNFSKDENIKEFYVILGAVFPIVIGAITAKNSDMEKVAGNFQVMISLKSRSRAYFAKLLALICGSLFSVGLASFIFGILIKASFFEMSVLFLITVIGSFSIYLIHLFLAFKFGSGATIGFSFVETLITLLFMTGLGDGVWYFFPWAWISRLCATFMLRFNIESGILNGEILNFAILFLVIFPAIFVGSILWFKNWDAKSAVGE